MNCDPETLYHYLVDKIEDLGVIINAAGDDLLAKAATEIANAEENQE